MGEVCCIVAPRRGREHFCPLSAGMGSFGGHAGRGTPQMDRRPRLMDRRFCKATLAGQRPTRQEVKILDSSNGRRQRRRLGTPASFQHCDSQALPATTSRLDSPRYGWATWAISRLAEWVRPLSVDRRDGTERWRSALCLSQLAPVDYSPLPTQVISSRRHTAAMGLDAGCTIGVCSCRGPSVRF